MPLPVRVLPQTVTARPDGRHGSSGGHWSHRPNRPKEIDRGRANYYNYYTGHNWGEMRQYDLTLNSSVTGVDGAVELIATLVRLWEKRDQESR